MQTFGGMLGDSAFRSVASLVLVASAAACAPAVLPAMLVAGTSPTVKDPEPSNEPVEVKARRRLRHSCTEADDPDRCVEMAEHIQKHDFDAAADARTLFYLRRACTLQGSSSAACDDAKAPAERLGCASAFDCGEIPISPDTRVAE